VQLAYAIGISRPLSIYVNSYDTVKAPWSDLDLQEIILDNWDLRPGMIIKEFDLKKPIYKKTAHFGHFGREDPEFTWEKVKNLSHEANRKPIPLK